MEAIFYDRRNKYEVKASELLLCNVIEAKVKAVAEEYPSGTPINTITSKYGDDMIYIFNEPAFDFIYKSKNCPEYLSFDKMCNYADLIFLRLE